MAAINSATPVELLYPAPPSTFSLALQVKWHLVQMSGYRLRVQKFRCEFSSVSWVSRVDASLIFFLCRWLFYFFIFVCLLHFESVVSWLAWYSLRRPNWLWTCADFSARLSRVLGRQTWATNPDSCWFSLGSTQDVSLKSGGKKLVTLLINRLLEVLENMRQENKVGIWKQVQFPSVAVGYLQQICEHLILRKKLTVQCRLF